MNSCKDKSKRVKYESTSTLVKLKISLQPRIHIKYLEPTFKNLIARSRNIFENLNTIASNEPNQNFVLRF
jgi:hypothetical protein